MKIKDELTILEFLAARVEPIESRLHGRLGLLHVRERIGALGVLDLVLLGCREPLVEFRGSGVGFAVLSVQCVLGLYTNHDVSLIARTNTK